MLYDSYAYEMSTKLIALVDNTMYFCRWVHAVEQKWTNEFFACEFWRLENK